MGWGGGVLLGYCQGAPRMVEPARWGGGGISFPSVAFAGVSFSSLFFPGVGQSRRQKPRLRVFVYGPGEGRTPADPLICGFL